MINRILIVDDEPMARIFERLLGGEFELATVPAGGECFETVREFGPDLVFLDVGMPGSGGHKICRQIKSSPGGGMIQVILVSAMSSAAERVLGYEAGADDYIVKPFDDQELIAKVRVQFRLRKSLMNLAMTRAKIEMYNTELEELVSERTREVVETRDVAVFALAKLTESRDPSTGQHLERMRSYSQILATHLSRVGPYVDQIDRVFLEELHMSSLLHDVGKVGTPDAILNKPGKLTEDEFEIIKQHSVIGAEALESAIQKTGAGSFLAMGADIARSHHERYSGTGYPDGLRGQDIPLAARIVALADVFDALTSERVYKSAIEPEVAKRMIEEEKGKHFDPAVVDAFVECWEDFLDVWNEMGDKQVELAGVGMDSQEGK